MIVAAFAHHAHALADLVAEIAGQPRKQITHMELNILPGKLLMANIAGKQQLANLVDNPDDFLARGQVHFANSLRFAVNFIAGQNIVGKLIYLIV